MDLNISAHECAHLINMVENQLPGIKDKTLRKFCFLILALLYDHQALEHTLSLVDTVQNAGQQVITTEDDSQYVVDPIKTANKAGISCKSIPIRIKL